MSHTTESLREVTLATLYQRAPLDATTHQVRVLDIQLIKSEITNLSQLTADVRILDLESTETIDFTTLSYVWGREADEGSPTITLRYEGFWACLKLTENCNSALVDLTLKVQRLVIWVDAVCINQGDTKEVTHQMSLMGRIYSASVLTYVWFGRDDESTTRAFGSLMSIGLSDYFFDNAYGGRAVIRERQWSACRTLYRQQWTFFLDLCGRLICLGKRFREHKSSQQDPFLLRNSLPKKQSLLLTDIASFCDQTWLRRVWTYQEIMLAKNPIVVCGKDHMPWSRFEVAVNYLRDTGNWSGRYRNGDTQRLFQILAVWQTLFRDRHSFQISVSPHNSNSNSESTPKDLTSRFFEYLAGVDRKRKYFGTLLSCVPGVFGIIMTVILRYLVAGAFWILGLMLVLVSLIQLFQLWAFPANALSIKRQSEVNKDRVSILTAIWNRKCKEAKDYNFGVRAVLQAFSDRSLEALSYDVSISEAFADLTSNMLHTFPTCEILQAAMRCRKVDGQPSWTVDWLQVQTDDFHLFREESRARSSHKQVYVQKNMAEPACITVRAFGLGTVLSTFRFVETADKYDPDEEALHLHNLDILISLLKTESSQITNAWRGLYELHLLPGHVQAINSYPANLAIRYIKTNVSRGSKKILAGLCQKSTWANTKLSKDTHPLLIMICNQYAKRKLCFFIMQQQSTGAPTSTAIAVALEDDKYHRGEKIEAGDEAIRIIGMPEVAVMRQQCIGANGRQKYSLVNSADIYDEFYRTGERVDGSPEIINHVDIC